MSDEKKPGLIKADEEIVLMWVVVPRSEYDKIKLVDRGYAKSVLVGKMGELTHKMYCAHWGLTISKSLLRLAQACCPELVDRKIIHPLDG